MVLSISIIVTTILLSAFFSGMEIAYVSSNKIMLEIEKKQSGFIPKILDRLTRKPSKYITTMLLGNNIALVIYGIYMGNLLVNLLTPLVPSQYAFINYWLTGSGLILTQTLISTFVILITAEFLPKVFFQIYANSILKFFALPAYIFYALFHLVSSGIMWISDTLLKIFFKIEGDEVQDAFTKVEISHYIDEQMETATDHEEMDSEVLIFKNALEFSDIKAREVMVPRTEIVAVDSTASLEHLKERFIETGLSKILIYKENIDDITGYIHSFELFRNPKSIVSAQLPVIYVPESILVKDVLNELIKKRKSMAVVIDEYGGTSGIITLEDIVEELFGEIEDEHDSVSLIEKELEGGGFRFSGRIEIDYLNDNYKIDLPKGENYETLAGLIVNQTEEIPQEGEVLAINGYQMKILKASNTKIELVEIHPLQGS